MLKAGFRFFLYTLGGLLAVVVAVFGYWLVPVMDDPVADYGPADTRVERVVEERRWKAAAGHYRQVTLYSQSGIRVPVSVRRPAGAVEHMPVMILLGGQGTGRDACALIDVQPDLVCVALSYPYEGAADLHGLSALWNVREVQAAIVNTPPAVLMVIDYIANRSELNAGHIELVGVSLGAFLASVPAALDTRVRRLWLVHGAAMPARVLSHQLREDIPYPWLRDGLGQALSVLIAGPYLKPERWVGRVAPRPVVLINAREDEALPAPTIRRLHAAAAQPREIIWTEGGHVLPGREAVIRQLTELVVQRIGTSQSP